MDYLFLQVDFLCCVGLKHFSGVKRINIFDLRYLPLVLFMFFMFKHLGIKKLSFFDFKQDISLRLNL